MAAAYQACSAALDKLGEPEAAWIAADRAMSAAERAGNPLLVAAGAFRLVFVFLSARHYAQAEETARTAADALWHLADDGNPEAMSLWGALTLQRAITAARTGDAAAAYAHLERAGHGGRLGAGRNDHNTEFGPANVALHEIAIAVELGDAGRALRVGGRAGYLGPVGRAAGPDADRRRPRAGAAPSGRRGRTALRQAEDMTPEQVAGHYLPRQIVSDLMTMQDPPSPELRALAVRLGVTRVRD